MVSYNYISVSYAVFANCLIKFLLVNNFRINTFFRFQLYFKCFPSLIQFYFHQYTYITLLYVFRNKYNPNNITQNLQLLQSKLYSKILLVSTLLLLQHTK